MWDVILVLSRVLWQNIGSWTIEWYRYSIEVVCWLCCLAPLPSRFEWLILFTKIRDTHPENWRKIDQIPYPKRALPLLDHDFRAPSFRIPSLLPVDLLLSSLLRPDSLTSIPQCIIETCCFRASIDCKNFIEVIAPKRLHETMHELSSLKWCTPAVYRACLYPLSNVNRNFLKLYNACILSQHQRAQRWRTMGSERWGDSLERPNRTSHSLPAKKSCAQGWRKSDP